MGELGLLSSEETCLFCSVRFEGFLIEPNSLATEADWLCVVLVDCGDFGEFGEDTARGREIE